MPNICNAGGKGTVNTELHLQSFVALQGRVGDTGGLCVLKSEVSAQHLSVYGPLIGRSNKTNLQQ